MFRSLPTHPFSHTQKAMHITFCVTHARAAPSSQRPLSLTRLEERVGRLRCPFWRRRASDAVDTLGSLVAWAASRHASLPTLSRHDPIRSGPAMPLSMRVQRIRADFEERQYYVTGRLSRELYAPDCVFDGPDPDTPVRGVKKWTSATAGLFDQGRSKIDLVDIRVVHEREVRADWRLEGVLNLPWKPSIKPYTGTTIYRFNERGLVYDHFEIWSISAIDAFVSVLWPSFGAPAAPDVSVLLANSGMPKFTDS